MTRGARPPKAIDASPRIDASRGRAARLPHAIGINRRSIGVGAVCLGLAASVMTLVLSGCGYNQSDYSQAGAFTDDDSATASAGPTSRTLYRDDVRTVAVPIFTNRSFERNVEFDLSKAIVQYIESATPYKVVPKERADTILEGEVTHVEIDTVSQSPFNTQPQEQLIEIRVNFTWKDLRTGRILTQRRRFEQSGTYYPTLGEGRFVGSQQQVERLAVAIVQELQQDW